MRNFSPQKKLTTINNLVKEGVLEKCETQKKQLLSIFLREGKDGGYRFILNLKYLNEIYDIRISFY